MTTLKWLLVAALIAAGLYFGLYTPGQAVMVYGDWSVEMPLALFAALAGLGFLTLHWSLQLSSFLRILPGRWRNRHEKRAQGTFEAALIAMSCGQWEEAEKLVLRHARQANAPYLHHLLAAFAAHTQGFHERRDDHLARARNRLANEPLQTVLLATARLRIAAQQWDEARTTLEELFGLIPKNAALLRLLAGVCERQSDWARVGVILPDLETLNVLSAQEFATLQARYLAVQIAAAKDETELNVAWRAVPEHAQVHYIVAAAYVRQCITHGKLDIAEALLRRAIKREWSTDLVALYGTLVSTQVAAQLNFAEDQLSDHGNDVALLITLAKLCVQLKLWDQALFHLNRCLGLTPNADAYALLMQIYHQQGDNEKSLSISREALDRWKESVSATTSMAPPAIPL